MSVRGTTGGPRTGGAAKRRNVIIALSFTAILLTSIPGTAWLYGGEEALRDLADVVIPEPPAATLSYARGEWVHDADGDKLDDRILSKTGTRSMIVMLDSRLDSARRFQLEAIPGLQILAEYTLFDGIWINLPVSQAANLAALDFVKHVELDVVWKEQLDVSARSILASDSRRPILADGSSIIGYRGVWRGDPSSQLGVEGYTGEGVTVAIIDGGIDDTVAGLDDMNDDGVIDDWADRKVAYRVNIWPRVLCTIVSPAPGSCPTSVTNARTGQQDSDPGTVYGPHATFMAGVIAGTGNTFGGPDANPFNQWAYPGVAPRARLGDINAYIGFEHDCRSLDDQTGCSGQVIPEDFDILGLGGDEGEREGVHADEFAGTFSFLPTGASIAYAADVVAQLQATAPMRVALMPFIDPTTCEDTDGVDTPTALSLQRLTNAGVTVVVPVGQGNEGLCSPTRVPQIVTVGAYDDAGTVDVADDQPWPSNDQPTQDQIDAGAAKPEVLAPGVDIFGPRARGRLGPAENPTDENLAPFWLQSGTSAAAAHVAGALAILVGADGQDGTFAMTPFDLKEALLSAARGHDEVFPYVDDENALGGPVPDGVRDEDPRAGWTPVAGYGSAAVRDAVCGKFACPRAWEFLRNIDVRLDDSLFETEPGKPITVRGRVVTNDPMAEQYWENRTIATTFRYGQPLPFVRVNFTMGECVLSCSSMFDIVSVFTDAQGRFELEYPIAGNQSYGVFPCTVFTGRTNPTPDRDGISASSFIPCSILVQGNTKFGCGPNNSFVNCILAEKVKLHTFQRNPEIDVIQGIVQLTDEQGDTTYTGYQDFTARWEGAVPADRVQTYTTIEGGGTSLATATVSFRVDGRPGCWPLILEYTPQGDAALVGLRGAAAQVTACVSQATSIEGFGIQGILPTTTFINDGTPLDVTVHGRLRTSAGEPVRDQQVRIQATAKGSTRTVATVNTDDNGTFRAIIDLRQFLSGSFNLFAEYGGKVVPGSESGSYILVPTTSQRFPFSILMKPRIVLPSNTVVFRGDTAIINGTLVNAIGRGIAGQLMDLRWEGTVTFNESARTNRNGGFRIEHRIDPSEDLRNVTIWATFLGGNDLSATFATANVEVRGRARLFLAGGQAARGDEAVIEGTLTDDTLRPLTGERVQITWASEIVGNATTNTLGQFKFIRKVATDERVGPIVVKAEYKGKPFIEGANAQNRIGIIAPVDLIVEQEEKRVQGGVEIATRILDDQGHPISDQRTLDFYLAAARGAEREYLTYLSSLDLSNSLTPRAKIRHGTDFNSNFGVSDGARLAVSIDGGRNWQPVPPIEQYDSQTVSALGGGPGWTGRTSGWFPVRFNLTDLANAEDARFRLRLKTSPLSNQIMTGMDSLVVRDGDRILFSDDFEAFGAKGYGDYWSLPGSGAGAFQMGRETVTGATRSVIGTNLEGQHPNSLNALALSPRITLPAGKKSFVLMRYHLDVGNSGDYASLLLEDLATSKATILSPYREPQFGTLAPTGSDWRWVLYEMPSSAIGKTVRIQLAFISDGSFQGTGFHVDEFRVMAGIDTTGAAILNRPDPNRWTLTNFEQGELPNEVDRYVDSTDSAVAYPVIEDGLQQSLRNVDAIKLTLPFPFKAFGQTFTTLTAFPEGVYALGDVGQFPSPICRADEDRCSLANLGFSVPLVAPAWDVDMVALNATLVTKLEGEAPNREFVLEWRGLEAPGAGPKGTKFQARMHEKGDIAFHYASLAFDDRRCQLDANDPMRIRCMDYGQHALVGITGASGKGAVTTSEFASTLTDNFRVYLSQVTADYRRSCTGGTGEPCEKIAAIVPNTDGPYELRNAAEAIYRPGFDLANVGEAYLVVRQYVEMGRGDQLQIQARGGEAGLWRPIPALQGGFTEALGSFHADRPGQWSTAVYDMSSFAGQRAFVRFQIQPDGQGLGQDIGVAVRELFVITTPRAFGASNADSFDSYMDTTRGGKTWWSSKVLGDTEANPPWAWMAHQGDIPKELGTRYLGLGNGKTSLAADTAYILQSPPLKLKGSKHPSLTYWMLSQMPDSIDGLVLEASVDGGARWQSLRPDGGGYVDYLDTLNGPGWAGRQFGLTTHTFDLTPYASNDVRFRLEYGTGATPFGSRWIIDDFIVEDLSRIDPATGKPVVYLHDEGRFSTDRWGATPGVWTPHAAASAVEHGRDALKPVAQLSASGGRLPHRIPLPRGTPRGPITATVLFPGVESTYGGDVWSSDLVVEQDTGIVGVTLRNDHDSKDYIVRNRTFVVEGILQDKEGAPVSNGLIQIELEGIVVGSATTGESGVFATQPIYVPVTFPTGLKRVTVKYGGDPKTYTLESQYGFPVVVKGLTGVIVEKQVARGEKFEVTLRAIDDQGAPLVRTAIDVQVGRDEIHELKTDAAGRATFITSVALEQNTLVGYEVESLGTDVLIGRTLAAQVTVPGEPQHDFPWWIVALAVLLLVLGIVAYILLARRRKRLVLVEELARKIELVEYALATGDPVRAAIFDLYKSFLMVLDHAGLRRPASETPAEMTRSLRASLPRDMEPAIESISELFQVARYSPHELGESERAAVQESLHSVRTLLERIRPAQSPGSETQ